MIQNRTLITGPTFLSLGLMGAFFAFWGTSLPALQAFLAIDIGYATLLTALGQAGHAVTCLAGGILSDLIRRDRVLMAGCFFLGSGALCLGAWDSYPAHVLLVLWMGIGSGLILSSSNALLVGLYPRRKGAIMNLHHGVFGIGSLLSPLIMGHLLDRGLNWQFGYRGLAAVLFAATLFFLFTRVRVEFSRGLRAFRSEVRSLVGKPDFVHLMLMGFLAVGTQFALMFLTVSFLMEVKGFVILEASLTLSGFFVCLFLGRLGCSWLSLHLSNSRIILSLLLLQAFSLLAAWQGRGALAATALAASGLACSGIFPCLLALTGNLFPQLAGTSLGILGTMNSLGGMTLVGLAGLAAQKVGLKYGFAVLVVSSLAGLVLFWAGYTRLLTRERASSAAPPSPRLVLGKEALEPHKEV